MVAFELPIPTQPFAAAYLRHTRRRGTDLASVTLACGVGADGVTRICYGSMGPRPFLEIDESGVLADPNASDEEKSPILDRIFEKASPSITSMRAGPEYRIAMTRVLGERALAEAIERVGTGGSA